ncbi:MAG: hypothetical protein V3W41_11875 [Planctomycetota bacterium]
MLVPSLGFRLRRLCLPFSIGAYAAACLLLTGSLLAQGGREQMWWAPSAEDWKKPCLIEFQRTWEDALALAAETGKPILICVNMDGEIASEHYAGIRYRQAKIAKLHEPYINVIASVYRHNPRDHDEHGNRILCPRFGSVTCGEHIAIEPILFPKFFDGKRIAPRHIMIEGGQSETYDVYHTFDTDSVFKAIGDGISERKLKPKNIVKGDRSIIERVASRDNGDRRAVESAYAQGDKKLRRSLLEAALKLGDKAPLELLRLALRGFDKDMTALAREALARATSSDATELVSDALRTPMEVKERETLIATLKTIGKESTKARRLAVVHGGLGKGAKTVNAKEWSDDMVGGASYTPARTDEQSSLLSDQDRVLASKNHASQVELAEAFLANALEVMQGGLSSRTTINSLLFEARDTALKAEAHGAQGWRVNAVLSTAAYHLEDLKEARLRAVAAASAGKPHDPKSWSAMIVLGLFAEARREAIEAAVKKKEDWPSRWLADVHAAYQVLAQHPYGTEGQIITHYDLLKKLGADGQADDALKVGLSRFPGSAVLHNRYRLKILKEKGIGGLGHAYDSMIKGRQDSADLVWYAGYASTLAAEFYRRRNKGPRAEASYTLAMKFYERFISENPDRRETSDLYIAMALGGRGRVAFEKGNYKSAVNDLIASFRRKPDRANELDGLNLSAVDTAKMVLARLRSTKKHTILISRLDKALGELDPAMLALPAFEGPRPKGSGRRRRRQE